MACKPDVLRQVPLFALLDDEEIAVLAGQVEVKTFAPRQRIWKIGDPSRQAYVMVSGIVRVTTADEDHQEVLVDEPLRASSSRRQPPRRVGNSGISAQIALARGQDRRRRRPPAQKAAGQCLDAVVN